MITVSLLVRVRIPHGSFSPSETDPGTVGTTRRNSRLTSFDVRWNDKVVLRSRARDSFTACLDKPLVKRHYIVGSFLARITYTHSKNTSKTHCASRAQDFVDLKGPLSRF